MKWIVEDWRDAWKWLSVQATALASLIWGAWLLLPTDQQVALVSMLGFDPQKVGPLLGFGMILIARMTAQPALDRPKGDQ